MKQLEVQNSTYISSQKDLSLLARIAPTPFFYFKFTRIVFLASRIAKRGLYSDDKWSSDSFAIMEMLESIGVRFTLSGLDNLKNQAGPCVIIGNHMSMMETVILPAIVRPFGEVTFVVKDSLLEYPVFKYVMRSRNPVAVTRTNPRKDFKIVMTEGVDRLKNNISVIVFPQTTRSHSFDPAHFGSIGVKLAKKAGVPIVPLALKTDTWQNGTYSKDLGRINTEKPVKMAFGKSFHVQGKGVEEHQRIVDFICGKLQEWQ